MINFTTEQWQIILIVWFAALICYGILYKFDTDE
jgi:hypothetical protein